MEKALPSGVLWYFFCGSFLFCVCLCYSVLSVWTRLSHPVSCGTSFVDLFYFVFVFAIVSCLCGEGSPIRCPVVLFLWIFFILCLSLL